MYTKQIAAGIALLFIVAVSYSFMQRQSGMAAQELELEPEEISNYKNFMEDIGDEETTEIINGFPMPTARVPFFTFLLMHDHYGRPVSSCAGALVSDDIVLTAAHCMFNQQQRPHGRIAVFGRLNDHFNPQNPFNPHTAMWRDVVNRFVAPNYNFRTFHNDFAILKLAGPIPGVPKPRFNNNPAIPSIGQLVNAIGYGNIRTGGPSSNRLLGVEIHVKHPATCARDLGPNYANAVMFCAGDFARGTCNGDSGGPVLIAGPQPWDDLQVGITSFGVNGCADRTPTVSDGYARVSAWYPTIRHFTCTQTSFPWSASICR